MYKNIRQDLYTSHDTFTCTAELNVVKQLLHLQNEMRNDSVAFILIGFDVYHNSSRLFIIFLSLMAGLEAWGRLHWRTFIRLCALAEKFQA